MTTHVIDIVSQIQPHDAVEVSHKEDVLQWIQSNAPLYRVSKPDNPPKHLVVYFVLYDVERQSLMLIDHHKAKAWLPTGGHVDIDEHPADTVVREAREELGLVAKFIKPFGDKPLFVTVTQTRGPGTHTDVSLWYVIEGDTRQPHTHDDSEFSAYKWLSFDQILATDISTLDPHMHRFVQKLAKITQ